MDPDDSSYEVVAKGVRNSAQQFKIFNSSKPDGSIAADTLVFMDIGGVTAEEVNIISVEKKLLNTKYIDNFGWDRSILDGKAREGTFYVAPGTMGVLGTEPPCCEGDALALEEGFIHPWIQFGCTETDISNAISSFAVTYKSFDKLELIWSEFNTGAIMGTTRPYYHGEKNSSPAKGYILKVFDIIIITH